MGTLLEICLKQQHFVSFSNPNQLEAKSIPRTKINFMQEIITKKQVFDPLQAIL
jgi:hypothetical protein